MLLYFALGGRSLAEHAQAVATPLAAGELDAARERVGWIVSRDTRALDAEGVAKAATESVLENGNDAVFGALFWFVLGGGAGVLLFRLANTLDAMWGYRTPRHLHFGWAAARIDDLLNWPAGAPDRAHLRAARAHGGGAGVLAHAGAGLGQPERRPGDGGGRGRARRAPGRRGDLPRPRGAPPAARARAAMPTSTPSTRAVALVRRGTLLWLALLQCSASRRAGGGGGA
jgi:adenosylcobinamide-phosphate synthase